MNPKVVFLEWWEGPHLARPCQLCGLPDRYGPANFSSGHRKLESTVRYLGIEVDDALEMSEQIDL